MPRHRWFHEGANMTDSTAPAVTHVEDDPTKPWKAVAALAAPAVLAFLVAILNQGPNHFPDWLWIVLTGAVAAVSSFVVPNPKRLKRTRNERGAGELGMVVVVLAIVILVVVLFRVL